MADVVGRQRGELVRNNRASVAVRLRIAGPGSEAGRLYERCVTVVMIERAVLLAGDDDVIDRQPGRRVRCRRGRPAHPEHSRSTDTGALEEPTAGDSAQSPHKAVGHDASWMNSRGTRCESRRLR